MEKPAFTERRRHGRARIHMEAILEGSRPEDSLRLRVENFSVGGFFCRINRAMKPMTRLGVTFQFPPYAEHPPRTIEGSALVVRCDPSAREEGEFDMAACFTYLPPDAASHIQGYVDWYELVYRGEDLPHGEARGGASRAERRAR
jgi:hypothetical protein